MLSCAGWHLYQRCASQRDVFESFFQIGDPSKILNLFLRSRVKKNDSIEDSNFQTEIAVAFLVQMLIFDVFSPPVPKR